MTITSPALPLGGRLGETGPAPEAVVPLTALFPTAQVDLMPREVREHRRFRRARTGMLCAVGACVLAAAAGAAVSFQDAGRARDELVDEQSRTAALQQEAATYAVVPAVTGSIERTRTSLLAATAADIAWYAYLDDIARSAPPSVWFDEVKLTLTDPILAAGDPLASPDAVATVTMSGGALAHEDVVAWLDSFAGLPTWEDPVFTESATDEASGALRFTTSARLSSGAFSGRWADQDFSAPRPAPTTQEGGQ